MAEEQHTAPKAAWEQGAVLTQRKDMPHPELAVALLPTTQAVEQPVNLCAALMLQPCR
jgi:hypothetical protein